MAELIYGAHIPDPEPEVTDTANPDLIALTADIVSAHVAHNKVSTSDLPTLITSIHAALSQAGAPAPEPEAAPTPAVPIRASVKTDYIVCLEDGKKLKMLKRYLRTNYDMTPEQYRAKWGLPRDYPMVAPAYAEQRKSLALKSGLGRRPAAAIEAVAEPVKTAVAKGRKTLGIFAAKAAAVAHPGDTPQPATRGRPKKAAEPQPTAAQSEGDATVE